MYMQPHNTKRSSKVRHVTIYLQRQPQTCLASVFSNCLNILAKAVLKIYLGYFFSGLRLFTRCILYPLKEKCRTNRSCRVLKDKALNAFPSQFSLGQWITLRFGPSDTRPGFSSADSSNSPVYSKHSVKGQGLAHSKRGREPEWTNPKSSTGNCVELCKCNKNIPYKHRVRNLNIQQHLK